MRISTSQIFSQGLNAILDQQAGVAKAQLQVATGKRILTPADDPAAAKEILDLNDALAQTRQFADSAGDASSRLSFEDNVLASATNVLQRVRELALQGNNATVTGLDRQAIARELEQRLAELLGLANSRDGNGEYLFAGFATLTEPFVADNAGNFNYQGDQGQRELQIAPSFRIADSNPGSEVFQAILTGNGTFAVQDNTANTGSGIIAPGSVVDLSLWVPDTYTITFLTPTTFEVRDSGLALITGGAYVSGAAISFNGIQTDIKGAPAAGDTFTVSASTNQDVFTTVQNLVTAFNTLSDNPIGRTQLSNAVNRVLTNIDQAFDNLSQVRASIGARLNAIESENNVNADFELLLQQDLSRIENADLAEVITLLNQRLTTLEAASQSFVRVQNLSLFNFI